MLADSDIEESPKLMKHLAVMILGSFILFQAPASEKLASGTYVVYAASPQIWRVKFDPKTMANATITGHFIVTDGNPKNIDVLVFDQQNYVKWTDDDPQVRTSAKPIASASRSGEGNINAKLADPGFHYLVISDQHEYEGKKTVSADFKFQYDRH